MQTSKITVEVVKSTEKAHLVRFESREGWVQRRWLGADNTARETLN